MAQYTTTTLLADIRTGGMLPNVSSAVFTDANLLRLADREMQIGIVPLVMSTREEFFVAHTDYTIATGAGEQSALLPARAIGGKVRDVELMVNGTTYQQVPQIDMADREGSNAGFYVEGNILKLYNPVGSWPTNTLRVFYFRRPSRLVATTAVGVVTTIVGRVVTVSSAPGTFSSSVTYDLVRQVPGYDCLAIDQAATLSVNDLTFAVALPTDPASLAVGDYVTLAEESPVPQIPPEMHPVLAQRVIVKVLEAIGDSSGMQAAQSKLEEAEHAALTLLSPRVDGEPKRIRNMSSPFRRRRRWLLY